jgi:hypothetical protein
MAALVHSEGIALDSDVAELGTTLGPHALHLTGQPARRRTQRTGLEPTLTRQNV